MKQQFEIRFINTFNIVTLIVFWIISLTVIRFDGTMIDRVLLLTYLVMYYNDYVLFLSGVPAWRLM